METKHIHLVFMILLVFYNKKQFLKTVTKQAHIFMVFPPFTLIPIVKLDEISAKNHLQLSWEGGEQSIPYGHQQAQSQGFFQPLECNPTLQIG